MAKLGHLDYDASEYDRNRSNYTAIPDGTYNVEIVACAQKKWENGGVQVGITYKIIDGDLEGRMIFDNLQVFHANKEVQSIARSSLHKICDNLQVPWPLADDELLIGGLQTITLKSKSKGGNTYQNVAARDVLQAGRVRQQNAVPAQKQAQKPAPKAASNNEVPW